MKQKFYKCAHCGNIIEKIEDKGVPVVCCGEAMQWRLFTRTAICMDCGKRKNFLRKRSKTARKVLDFC